MIGKVIFGEVDPHKSKGQKFFESQIQKGGEYAQTLEKGLIAVGHFAMFEAMEKAEKDGKTIELTYKIPLSVDPVSPATGIKLV